MALHFANVEPSLLWLQTIDPYSHADYDVTPEECVRIIDCMVNRYSISECARRTGIRRDTAGYWYGVMDHLVKRSRLIKAVYPPENMRSGG